MLCGIILWPLATELMRRPMDREARRAAEGELAMLSSGVTHCQWSGPARGPVAVCVHGLTTPSFVWRGLARGLEAWGYRVLTYDLYGRGFSDRPAGRQDTDFFVEQLEELLEHQGVTGDTTLFGYSMGGAIGTAFAARHPDRIRHLILLAPAGLSVPQGRLIRFIRDVPWLGDWLMLALFPIQHRRSVEAERAEPSSVHDIVDRQKAELTYRGYVSAVLASLRGILALDFEPEFRTLRDRNVPVIAIWGDQDRIIPMSAVGRLAELCRHAKQDVIKGAGHGLPYTHTDRVLAALRQNMAPDD